MIDIEMDGMSILVTQDELQGLIENLDRAALIRLCVKFAGEITRLRGFDPKGKPSVVA